MSSLLDQFSTYATKVDDTLVSSVTSYGDTSQASVRGAMEDQRLSTLTPTLRWKERIIKEKQSQTGKTSDSLFFNTRLPLDARLPHVVNFIRMFFDHLLRDGVVHLHLPPTFEKPEVKGVQPGGTESAVTSLDTWMTISVKSFFRYYKENVPEEFKCFKQMCDFKRAILNLGLESIVSVIVMRNRAFKFNALEVWDEIKHKYAKKPEKPVEVRKVSTSEGLVSPDVKVGKKILIDFCEEIYRHGKVYIGHKPSGFYVPLAKDVSAVITQESMYEYYRAHTTQQPIMEMNAFNRSIIDLGLGRLCRLIKKNGCYFWTLNAKHLLHELKPGAPKKRKVSTTPSEAPTENVIMVKLILKRFCETLLTSGRVWAPQAPPGFCQPLAIPLGDGTYSIDVPITITHKSLYLYYGLTLAEYIIYPRMGFKDFNRSIIDMGLVSMVSIIKRNGHYVWTFNAKHLLDELKSDDSLPRAPEPVKVQVPPIDWDEVERNYFFFERPAEVPNAPKKREVSTPEKRPVEVPNAPKKRKVSTSEERLQSIETAVATLIDKFTEFTEGNKTEAPKVKETVVHTPEKRPVQVPNTPKKRKADHEESWDDMDEQRRWEVYMDMNDEWTSRYCGFGPNGLW